MDDTRFQQLYDAARKAYLVRGDDVTARSKARREYRQALDLLELEATPEQWARVQSAIDSKWR